MNNRVVAAFCILLFCIFNISSSGASAPIRLSASAQSYDPRLFGTWEVQTVVVDSDCKYVRPGLKSISKLNFRLVHGRLTPTWFGHEWDSVANDIFKLSDDDKIVWIRENKLRRGSAVWLARSKDIFDIKNHNYITAKSEVEQYLNGRYTGDYKTISYLKKL